MAFRKQTASFIESGFGLVDSQSPLVTLVALGTRQAAQTVRICPFSVSVSFSYFWTERGSHSVRPAWFLISIMIKSKKLELSELKCVHRSCGWPKFLASMLVGTELPPCSSSFRTLIPFSGLQRHLFSCAYTQFKQTHQQTRAGDRWAQWWSTCLTIPRA